MLTTFISNNRLMFVVRAANVLGRGGDHSAIFPILPQFVMSGTLHSLQQNQYQEIIIALALKIDINR